jgi:hypothetical protein
MRYCDILIKMLLYLLNHSFYSKLNNYNNKQSLTTHDSIFNILTTQINGLPLLSNIDNLFISYHGFIQNMLNTKNNDL